MNNPQVHITLLHKNTPLYDINMSKNNILPVLQRCMLESSLRLWHLFLLQHCPKSSISHCEQSEWMCLYSSETDSDMGRGLPYKLLHQRLNLYGKHNLHFKMKSNMQLPQMYRSTVLLTNIKQLPEKSHFNFWMVWSHTKTDKSKWDW